MKLSFNLLLNSVYSEQCFCAGVGNQYNEGDVCALYRGYSDEWRNGMWCNVNTSFCSDARAHQSKSLPGYGASRKACRPGMSFQMDNFATYFVIKIILFINELLSM